MGRQSWNSLFAGPQGTNAPTAVPTYVQYNAFRWLRDSGFWLNMYLKTNTNALAEIDLSAGLLRYAYFDGMFPLENGLGILAFGKRREPFRVALQPWFLWGVYAGLIVLWVSGAGLFWLGRRTGKRKVVQVGLVVPTDEGSLPQTEASNDSRLAVG